MLFNSYLQHIMLSGKCALLSYATAARLLPTKLLWYLFWSVGGLLPAKDRLRVANQLVVLKHTVLQHNKHGTLYAVPCSGLQIIV
jgi:hypothetical protein